MFMMMFDATAPASWLLVTACVGVIGIGAGILLSGIIGGGLSLGGTVLQSRAAGKGNKVQAAADQAALDFEKAQEKQRQKEYDEERARKWMQEDEAQKLLMEDRKIRDAELARSHQITDEDRAIAEEMRQRKLRLSKPYTDLGGASVAGLRQLMSAGSNAPSYYLPERMPPLPAGPINQLPSRNIGLAPMPSLLPNMVPVTVPDATTLADLARRR